MTAEIEIWKQEPVSPDWFEIDDWTDYSDTTLLDEIDLIIKDEPQYSGSGCWAENGGYSSYSSPGNGPGSSWNTEEAQTCQLLQEFEDVLSRQLTPPESPTASPQYYQQPPIVQPSPSYQQPQLSPPHHLQQVSSTDNVNDLDAIVAESFVSSDCTSSSDSGYEDPDWAPVTSKTRTRPYPSIEERKARKKEQNKNAATRYRQKKKQEIEIILNEERELQEKNESLKAEVDEVSREIKYLKSLMRHMFKAKGIIP